MAGNAGKGEETLRLEGFADSLRHHRVLCVSSHFKEAEKLLKGRVAAVDMEVVHRGRRVLFFQSAAAVTSIPKWLMNLCAWDAVFHIRDVQDLKLGITYVQYATKPVRVVWAGSEPSANAMGALGKIEGLTVIGLSEKAPAADGGWWHALFWGPSATLEEVEPVVHARMGTGSTGNLRSVLKELRGSDVGLVWSSIGESDKRGALYWYDPGEGVAPASLDMREAAETLRAVADALSAS